MVPRLVQNIQPMPPKSVTSSLSDLMASIKKYGTALVRTMTETFKRAFHYVLVGYRRPVDSYDYEIGSRASCLSKCWETHVAQEQQADDVRHSSDATRQQSQYNRFGFDERGSQL
ncbi:hypothetical protein B9Z65_3333 [Elsinoe australis]|uniref:Uncharacterized protein n=1 Tax=Elsinoe australis TaxID=40998 RepID=A0A2P7ZY52_9PEZI|nr:hypothetical protein B9Z65_3333 [Elsinoe australis]